VALRPLVALVFAAGCGGSGTSLVIELSLRAGDPAPSSLQVSVFGDKPLAFQSKVASPTLPGRLLVQSLPNVDQTLKVAVDGMSTPRTEAGTSIAVAANQQTTVALTLSSTTADTDGDGVPDSIDDCVDVADPRQDMPCTPTGPDFPLPPDLTLSDLLQLTGDLAQPWCGVGLASSCATSGLPFCDGFEGAMIDTSKWGEDLGNGTLSLDNGTAAGSPPPCRGGASLSSKLDLHGDVGTYGQADLNERKTFPSDPIYVRFFLWYPHTTPAAGLQFGQVSQDASPWGGITFGVDAYRHFYFGPYTIPSMGAATGSDPLTVPLDRWVCIEWLVSNGAVAGNSGISKVWLDGVEIMKMELTPLSTGSGPQFGLFEFGMDTSDGPQPPFGVWFDEVAIDSQPIGCAK
jgi:hypothetical protein